MKSWLLWALLVALPSAQGSDQMDHQSARGVPFSLDSEPVAPLPLPLEIDPAKRALGQALFFDKRISAKGEQSCADCHQLPEIAPAEPPTPLLNGGLQGRYKRKIPLLYNVTNYFWLNWDGRYTKLERLIEESISDVDKFNSSWTEVLAKLAPSYQRQAQQLFGTELTAAGVVDALASFVRSLSTPDAAFDRYLRGDAAALSPEQLQGYALFKQLGCSSCHNGRSIGANAFMQVAVYRHDDGKEGEPRLRDLGRYYVTGEESDRNSFRVPSLRNVALTAPYFHNGSAQTLEEAVEEMAEHQLGIILSDAQVALLVTFLHSLTGHHPGIQPSGVQP